jgi:hypothetical protein
MHPGKRISSALFCLCALNTFAQAQDLAALASRHATLREQLLVNQFQRPLYLESSETGGEIKGNIYARVAYPLAVVAPVLRSATQLCDILVLHLNVKDCRAAPGGQGVRVHMGRKYDQPLADTYLFEFAYTEKTAHDYLQVMLNCAKGPFGTSDYRVAIEVIPLDGQNSFLHLSYSYKYGVVAQVAMRSYLTMAGRDKVGFSVVGRRKNGTPVYKGSVRGVVERNTMRYYLAIEAYLGAPAAHQLDKRLNDWHTAVERYPIQLHEMDRAAYLAMKHKEVKRQQTALVAAALP